jgi:hypothetical protein
VPKTVPPTTPRFWCRRTDPTQPRVAALHLNGPWEGRSSVDRWRRGQAEGSPAGRSPDGEAPSLGERSTGPSFTDRISGVRWQWRVSGCRHQVSVGDVLTGIARVTIEPYVRLLAVTWPPCASMMALTIVSPRPNPRSASPGANAWNGSPSSDGNPGPESVTVISARRAAHALPAASPLQPARSGSLVPLRVGPGCSASVVAQRELSSAFWSVPERQNCSGLRRRHEGR